MSGTIGIRPRHKRGVVAQDAPVAFFSYSREDSDFALKLAGDLKAARASVWLDQLDIRPGDRWDRTVEEALTNCPRMLVILSPASVSSTNVMDEVSFALEERKTVIPVMYRDCTVPFRLRRVQYVDFRHDYAHGLQELLNILAPGQKAEQSSSGISAVGSQDHSPVSGAAEVQQSHEQAWPEEERQKAADHTGLAEQGKQHKPLAAQVLRAKPSGPDFFSESPALPKLALAACGILILVSFLFWASSRRRSGGPSRGTQQEEVKSEASQPPAFAKPESNHPQGSPTTNEVKPGRPEASAPVQSSPTQGQPTQKEGSVTSIMSETGHGKKGNTDELNNAKNLLKSGRFSEAIPLFRQGAATGNIEALYYLGLVYEKGLGVTPDFIEARRLYEKGASGSNAAAMARLGSLYEYGHGVPKDYQIAREWYEKGIALGNGGAMAGLGSLYVSGRGVPQDDQKAKEWFEKGVAAGDDRAMNNLGAAYASGRAAPQDYQKAREWYEKAAAAGYGRAMTNLGHLYESGHGVPQDYQKAKDWFEKGVAAGDGLAMSSLGYMYESGHGVPQDYQKAKDWYEKGAAAGDGLSMHNLGALYASGQGVPKDYEKAKDWYEKGAAADSARAMNNLGVLYEYGRGVPQDYQKAKDWYEKAAAAGQAVSMTNLGLMYEHGRGVPKDYQKAKEWYEKGAAAGDERAKDFLRALNSKR